MNKRQKIVQEAFINDEEAVIRRLKKVYDQAQKDIDAKAKDLQKEIEGLDALYDSIEDEKERARIKSMRQSKVYQKQYQDAMKKQVSGILDTMQVEEFKTVSDYLNKCYEQGFLGTMYDLQGQGIPLAFPMDQEAVVRAVQLDSKISQGLYNRLGEDVSLLKRKITATISRGVSTGMRFEDMAKQLAGYTKIGYNNAVRIARTEGHRIQIQSGMDACYKAKERGADIVKQWDSTLDGATRESHQQVDGEIRELDEPFSNGLMYPADPSGGAAEVVNCRCALLQRARWALGNEFTKYDNFSGELKQFENDAAYKAFKKDYFSKENVQYMKHVEAMEKKYGKKNFLAQMTDDEFKKFKSLEKSRPTFDGMYQGQNVIKIKATDFDGFKKEYMDVIEKGESLEDALSRCKTSKEVSEVTQNHFKNKAGCKIQEVDFEGIDVETAKRMAAKLDDLDSRFDSALKSIKIKDMDSGIGGQSTPTMESLRKLFETDDMDVLETDILLNRICLRNQKAIMDDFETFNRPKFGGNVAQNPLIDIENADLNILVHEYGHSILAGKAMELYVDTGGTNPTFNAARRMYRMYMKELKDIQREIQKIRDSYIGQPDGMRKGIEAAKELQEKYDSLCISKYSKESVGEFIAEAFCDYELSSNPKPASVKLHKLLEEQLGKGVKK